jgi:hypothetical protein
MRRIVSASWTTSFWEGTSGGCWRGSASRRGCRQAVWRVTAVDEVSLEVREGRSFQ